MAGKRRWFQIHLSTACVAMFVAAVLVWVNLRIGNEYFHISNEPHFLFHGMHFGVSELGSVKVQEVGPMYGWPFLACYDTITQRSAPNPMFVFDDEKRFFWYEYGLIGNALIALALLAATAFGCEWWIRRRERKQKAGT